MTDPSVNDLPPNDGNQPPILNVPEEEQAVIEDIRRIDDPLDRLHAYAERLASLPWTSALIRVLALEMAAVLIEQERRLVELERPPAAPPTP